MRTQDDDDDVDRDAFAIVLRRKGGWEGGKEGGWEGGEARCEEENRFERSRRSREEERWKVERDVACAARARRWHLSRKAGSN